MIGKSNYLSQKTDEKFKIKTVEMIVKARKLWRIGRSYCQIQNVSEILRRMTGTTRRSRVGEKNEQYNRETDEWLTTTTGAARRLIKNQKIPFWIQKANGFFIWRSPRLWLRFRHISMQKCDSNISYKAKYLGLRATGEARRPKQTTKPG